MKVIYSVTSSKGNCSVIQGKKGDKLIIDCGIKFNIVDKACNYELFDAVGLIASHFHS